MTPHDWKSAPVFHITTTEPTDSTGVGAFWNVLNLGQMLLWHIMLLPLGGGVIVVLHVVLVRLRGVAPPIGIGADGEPTGDGKGGR